MTFNQRGISLPELLIALLLSSFISIALVHHYQTIKYHYRHIQSALSEDIDRQLISDLIRNSSRQAGFTPCLGIDNLITIDQRTAHTKLVAVDLHPEAKMTMQINRMSPNFNTVLQKISDTQLKVTEHSPFQRDQVVVIADCYHAEVQNIHHIQHLPDAQLITFAHPFYFSYQSPVYVGLWLEELYSIRQKKDGTHALFMGGQRSEELMPGIHTLSTHLESQQGRRLIQVTLGLVHGHQIDLETMIRTL